MPSYKQVHKTTTVPRGSGIDAYLGAIRAILERPRVQEVTLRVGGILEYTRYVQPEESEQEPDLDIEGLLPYNVLRNSTIEELVLETPKDAVASIAIARMFSAVYTRGLKPTHFVMGNASRFWDWHFRTTGVGLTREDDVYGLPVLLDKDIENDTLFLCAGFTKTSRLQDTRHAYKICFPPLAKGTAP